jgi:hypothetical protein
MLPARRRWSGIAIGVLVLSVLACAANPRAQTQVDVVVDPTMVRGTLSAPVTIVEFSDYQ